MGGFYMNNLFLIISCISFLCIPVFVLWALLNLIRKKPAKKTFIFSGISTITLIISFVGFGLTMDNTASDTNNITTNSSTTFTDSSALQHTKNPTSIPLISVEPTYEAESAEKKLQDYAVKIITENYTYTSIESISINENLGTDEDGDYIILARLTWNQKNKASTSKEMLSMYSSDFAARIGTEQPSVKEVAIFWTIPYLDNASAKWSYERVDAGMQLSDNMLDSIFAE